MWYYCVNGKVNGPVDDRQLKALAEQEVFSPIDQVNKQGTLEWVDAGKVKGLFPSEIVMHYIAKRNKAEATAKTLELLMRYGLALVAVIVIAFLFYRGM